MFITHQVYDNIFVEGVPPLSRYIAHVHHSLRIICIDVENRSIYDPRYIRGVRRGTCHPGVCSEANLWGREENVQGMK